MTGSFTVELAEAPDVVERNGWAAQRLIAGVDSLGPGEMKRRPEQHGRMAVRQHKAISIRPDRVLRVKAKNAIPDGIDKRRKRHGGPGMSGLSLLNCVNRKCTNGIDAQLIELCGRKSFNCRY